MDHTRTQRAALSSVTTQQNSLLSAITVPESLFRQRNLYPEQRSRLNTEVLRQTKKRVQGYVLSASLDLAQVGPGYVHRGGGMRLRLAGGEAQLTQSRTQPS